MSFAPLWGRDRETSRRGWSRSRQESNLWTPLRQSDRCFAYRHRERDVPNEMGPFRHVMVFVLLVKKALGEVLVRGPIRLFPSGRDGT